jgi:guanosine-3',5'-bis(diphosphate) 3'-pyrophosphohydrolase
MPGSSSPARTPQETLAGISGAREALAFLAEAYDRRLRRRGRTIEHPIAVAELLAAEGEPAPVVLSGLLHDVLEDTDVTADELAERFGTEVASMVAALTQDPALSKYRPRKAALRRQVMGAGPAVAHVALADKLAKLGASQRRPRRRRLDHYRATLDDVEARFGPTPLGDRLRDQLARWPNGN